MRYCVGSKSRPNTALSKSSSRISSVPPIMMMAAIATPIWLPMPPSTTMATITADSMKVKLSGEMKPCRAAKNEPAKPREHRADGERRELGVGGVDAERAAGDLVLAQGFPGAPDRQPPQPQRDEGGEQRQRQDHVIKKDRAVDRANSSPKRAAKPSSLALNGMPKKVGRGMPLMPA